MATFHCELAWLGGDEPVADVRVDVAGDRIVAVQAGSPPTGTRLAGLTLPGFANAHSHAFHRALRGRTHAGAGDFWAWRERMYAITARLDPDTYHALARAVYAEMVTAGYTAVGEFHYLHHRPDGAPYAHPNEMGAAIVAAAAEAGIRLTLLDTCYLHGGVGNQPPDEVQRRFSDGTADAWADRARSRRALASDTVRLGAAVHSVRAVDPDSITTVAEVAAAEGWPLHAHVSEQPAENAACKVRHGRTPTELLGDRGALGEAFTAVHATHLADSDVALLGGARCTVCVCPTTERELADGIGPAPELVAAGVRLALGSDSHAVVDPIEETRALELDERLRSGRRGTFDVAALLAAATCAGHAALGWPEAGRIAPGAIADLVTVDLGSARTAGATAAEALGAAVFAATAADVVDVVVGGRHVVSGGRHRTIDVAAELQRAIGALS